MLVPAGIIWPFPRSISLIASRKCIGAGGNSRIASLRTWKTIELTLILYSWWERSTCEVCLGYVYKDSDSLIGVGILRNEISLWARLSDCKNLLHAWPIYPKWRILSHVSGEAKSCLQTVLVGMHMEKLYLNICWFTILKIGGYTSPSGLVFWELFMLFSKVELYHYKVHCKELRVWGSRYVLW